MFDTTHAHITTWVVALILFVIALVLHKSGNQKGMKIVQMILRLFYVLIILTGILLFIKHQTYNPALYGIKLLGGLVVIGMMEMILIRSSKEKNTGALWIVFIVAFAITFFLGLKLPLGWNIFA